MKKIFKFIKLTLYEKKIFLEVVYYLAASRLLLIFKPFKKIAPALGKQIYDSRCKSKEVNLKEIKTISKMIYIASKSLPWNCKCLVQAITAKAMLSRRNISCTIYFGLAEDNENKLIAHAWVKCHDIVVTGKTGMNRFKVINTFG